jgi:hypothetical protein
MAALALSRSIQGARATNHLDCSLWPPAQTRQILEILFGFWDNRSVDTMNEQLNHIANDRARAIVSTTPPGRDSSFQGTAYAEPLPLFRRSI